MWPYCQTYRGAPSQIANNKNFMLSATYPKTCSQQKMVVLTAEGDSADSMGAASWAVLLSSGASSCGTWATNARKYLDAQGPLPQPLLEENLGHETENKADGE